MPRTPKATTADDGPVAPPPGYDGAADLTPEDDELDPSRSRVTGPPGDATTGAGSSSPTTPGTADESATGAGPADDVEDLTGATGRPWTRLFRASTREPDPAIAQSIAGNLGLVFSVVGLGLNRSLTPAPPPNDVWVVTDDDVMGVCLPLARIAARRIPVSGALAGDAADALDALGGAVAYVVNNANRQVQYRAVQSGAAAPAKADGQPDYTPPPGKAPGSPVTPAGDVDLGDRMPPPGATP